MAATVRKSRRHPVRNEEAEQHAEGAVARGIEHYTAQLPSDVFFWAVGQWAPTFLLLGIYNKIVKVAGSDRVHES
jgi:hypothetical protein